jgi:hypothetical protein
MDAILDASYVLAADCRDNGTRFRLKLVLDNMLRELLPEDIHHRYSSAALLATMREQGVPDLKCLLPILWPQNSKQGLATPATQSCHGHVCGANRHHHAISVYDYDPTWHQFSALCARHMT